MLQIDLSSLIAIARGGFLPTKKLTDLTKDNSYMVSKLKLVSTKYGEKAVLELEREFDVFMPKKVSEAIANDENMFNNLQDAVNKYQLFITYKGGFNVEFNIK